MGNIMWYDNSMGIYEEIWLSVNFLHIYLFIFVHSPFVQLNADWQNKDFKDCAYVWFPFYVLCIKVMYIKFPLSGDMWQIYLLHILPVFTNTDENQLNYNSVFLLNRMKWCFVYNQLCKNCMCFPVIYFYWLLDLDLYF